MSSRKNYHENKNLNLASTELKYLRYFLNAFRKDNFLLRIQACDEIHVYMIKVVFQYIENIKFFLVINIINEQSNKVHFLKINISAAF